MQLWEQFQKQTNASLLNVGTVLQKKLRSTTFMSVALSEI